MNLFQETRRENGSSLRALHSWLSGEVETGPEEESQGRARRRSPRAAQVPVRGMDIHLAVPRAQPLCPDGSVKVTPLRVQEGRDHHEGWEWPDLSPAVLGVTWAGLGSTYSFSLALMLNLKV